MFGQNVVVSEYFNSTYPSDEWAELLINEDNVDLRSYTFRGNNSNQNNWGTPIMFTTNYLWANLRAGTIIIIWFRNVNSSNIAITLDTNGNDGFIQVHCMLASHFSYSGSQATVFGLAPYTTSKGNAFEVANNGDLYQIRDASANHVYALGHRSSVGSDFTSISGTNKLNHAAGIAGGDNVYVCPGGSISDYNQGVSGTTYTSKGSTNITQGLPNSCLASTTSNQNYWRSLRQPTFTNPTLNTITANSNGTQFNLSWSSCTDPNPSDSTTGYLILRNTTNSFTDPTDNTIYNDGNTIGTATVVKHINFSSTLAFTDNYILNCGGTLYYKIYAFRYKADNNNVINLARGRAYNETGTNVQSIVKSQPVSQNILAN
ncbi:MAG: hypothetical protein ACEQSR_07190 [Candidatus Methylacidiphilales bacterium]